MSTQNTLKTVVLLAALTGLFALVGHVLGGATGMIIALGFAFLMNGAAYWFGDRLALTMAEAHPATQEEASMLHDMVEDLALRARVAVPRVYVIEKASPNALAVGRSPRHATIAVTTGIMEWLTPNELHGALAHEFAHIKNRDILISTLAATIAGAITAIANIFEFSALFGHHDQNEEGRGPLGNLVFVLVAPIAVTIIRLAISRAREFEADTNGARLCGNPLYLVNALKKLDKGTWLRPMQVNPAVSPLYIVYPFAGRGITRLFQTHPPVSERVSRLEAMAGHAGVRTVGFS